VGNGGDAFSRLALGSRRIEQRAAVTKGQSDRYYTDLPNVSAVCSSYGITAASAGLACSGSGSRLRSR